MYLEFVVIRYGKTHRNRNKYHEKKTLSILADLPRNRSINCHSEPLQEARGLVRKQKESEAKIWVAAVNVISLGKGSQGKLV